MPRDSRRAARLMAKRPRSGATRPRSGPWVAGEPGWTICDVHNFGVEPDSTCLVCRLEAA